MEQQPPMQPPWEPTQPGSQPLPQPSGPFGQPPGPPPYSSQPMPPQGYYPPQGPAYPQMAPPQPPKRSRRTLWIILGSVAAVLLICCVGGIAVIANGGKNTSNNATTSSSSSPVATSQSGVTPTTAPAAGNHKIGDTVNFNNEWQVTINSASLSNGDPSQFDPTPDAGKTYLIIEGTFKNLTNKAQPLSTLLYFELRDAQGNKYDETLLLSITPPDSGGIEAGGLSHGKWPYEVPTSVHAFTLAFDSDLTGEPAIWDISV